MPLDPADSHKLGWNEMLAWLCSKCWACMGFGGATYLGLLIPVVNLVIMPAPSPGRCCSGCAKAANRR